MTQTAKANAEREVIIRKQPPENVELPENAKSILDVIGESVIEDNAVAYERDGFQYMLFFVKTGLVVCASRKLTTKTAIKHDSVLNQFNLRSEYGSCSICKYDELHLFFYRAEINYSEFVDDESTERIFMDVDNEIELEYGVLNRL